MSDSDDGLAFAAAVAAIPARRPPVMQTEVGDGGNTVYRTGASCASAAPAAAAPAPAPEHEAGASPDEVGVAEVKPKKKPKKAPKPGSKRAPAVAEERLVTLADLRELCHWIPLRLTFEERRLLLLLEGALHTSEYTDNVDVARNNFGWGQGRGYRGEDRMLDELREFCQLVVGQYVASDLKRASAEVEPRASPFEFRDLLRTVFEVGRRYKIQNPTKMRTTYGKLMHILMDAVQPATVREIGVDVFVPTQTVESLLAPFGDAGAAFLADPDLLLAASPIDHTRGIADSVGPEPADAAGSVAGGGGAREDPQAGAAVAGSRVVRAARELRMREGKAAALARIKARHTTNNTGGGGSLPPAVVERCLQSVGDALAFISVSTASVEAMIDLLLHFFDPRDDAGGADNRSLQLRYGSGGSRLSHSHPQQFKFVLQTLLLWKEIIRNMYRLWSLTDQDLIGSGGHYELRNTGQGMNRVQAAPKLQRAMSEILGKVQSEVAMSLPELANTQLNEPEPPSSDDSDDGGGFFGMRFYRGWVGLSVVHLGDRDVPNALFFIDKYTQVSRILDPIVHTVLKLGTARHNDRPLYDFARREYGSIERAQRVILQSYFCNGFDGSGDDGGSCIDGRLTSSWNWCSKIEKKAFFPLFLLCDFVGFDGDFRQ